MQFDLVHPSTDSLLDYEKVKTRGMIMRFTVNCMGLSGTIQVPAIWSVAAGKPAM